MGVVGISGLYEDGKFCGREVVFSDEMLVYAGDICPTINQGMGVDDFH